MPVPGVEYVFQDHRGTGTIHLSRVVAIILAFMAFGMFMFFAVTFILLPLFGQINDLVAKLPDYTTKSSLLIWTGY